MKTSIYYNRFVEDRMSRNMKIVLGIIGGLLVCCGAAVVITIIFLPRLASNFAEESFIEAFLKFFFILNFESRNSHSIKASSPQSICWF